MRSEMIKLLKRIIASVLAALVILEIVFRVVLSFKIGPDVLLYGTRFGAFNQKEKEWKKLTTEEGNHNVINHTNIQSNYSKYYPNQKRRDIDKHGNSFDVKINSEGFRDDDFKTNKDSNTFRIITLGASSTFGYGDRDDETYPFYLGQILNKYEDNLPIKNRLSVEVYNMGIPHLNSSQILSLFQNEALAYQPDVVTFYEGINDCAEFKKSETGFEKATRRLLILRFLEEVIHQKGTYSEDDYLRISPGIKENFEKKVKMIAEICHAKGICFYLVTQQAKSYFISPEKIKGISYAEEQKLVRERMQSGKLTLNELYFALHGDVMDYVRAESKNGINIIEGIYALDSVRNELTSWVHLSPKANFILANAISDRIRQDKLLDKSYR